MASININSIDSTNNKVTDPAQRISPDILGRIMVESENLKAAILVSKLWGNIANIYGSIELCNDFQKSSHLQTYVPTESDLTGRERVTQTLRRFKAHLQHIDPMAAKALNERSYPNRADLKNLETDACLSKLFNRLLKQNHKDQSLKLPTNFHLCTGQKINS